MCAISDVGGTDDPNTDGTHQGGENLLNGFFLRITKVPSGRRVADDAALGGDFCACLSLGW